MSIIVTLRRVQKFILPIKVVFLFFALGLLGYLIIFVPPTLVAITLAGLVIFSILSVVLSLFFSMGLSLLVGLTVAFLLFLRAVDLLTPINLVLFVLFVGLLILYFRPR